jgi:hypothetical protein
MTFVRLPAVALVPHSEVEALRQKFAESRSAADRDRFWMAVQDSKQPVIEEHADYDERLVYGPQG